jgi:hypothetical protein
MGCEVKVFRGSMFWSLFYRPIVSMVLPLGVGVGVGLVAGGPAGSAASFLVFFGLVVRSRFVRVEIRQTSVLVVNLFTRREVLPPVRVTFRTLRTGANGLDVMCFGRVGDPFVVPVLATMFRRNTAEVQKELSRRRLLGK